MSGISTFDLLGDMPPAQRTLMRLFLRQVEMTMAELEAAVAKLPEERRLSKDEILETLAVLLDKGWVRKVEQDGREQYTVQQLSAKH